LVQAARVNQRKDRPLPHTLREGVFGEAGIEHVGGQVERDFHFFTILLFHFHYGTGSSFTAAWALFPRSAVGCQSSTCVVSRVPAYSPGAARLWKQDMICIFGGCRGTQRKEAGRYKWTSTTVPRTR